ncbi:MAG: TolC family protein [Bacteroidota bacterium]
MPLLNWKNNYILLLVGLLAWSPETFAQQLLTKADAARLTLENNFGIQIADNNIRQAENNAQKEGNGYLPTLNGNAGLNVNYGSSTFRFRSGFDQSNPLSSSVGGNAGLQANYTLFDRVRDTQLEQLKDTRQLSELQKRQTVENTLLQVFTAYYEVARQRQNLQVQEQTIEVSRRRLERARYRYDYGQGLRLDVLNAKVDIQRDSINYLNNRRQLANSKRDLNVLMNQDIRSDFEVDTAITYVQDWQLEQLITAAKEDNVDMLLNQQNRYLSEYDLKIIDAGKKPTIDASAGYTVNLTRYDQKSAIDAQSNQGLNLGLTLNWNILDGGSRKIRRENTRINIQNQLLEKQQLEQTLERDVTNTWESYRNALFVLKAEAISVSTNQLNLQRTLEQFNAGQVTSVEFRQAQLNLLNAATSYNNAKFDAKVIELQLLQLSGKMLSEEW